MEHTFFSKYTWNSYQNGQENGTYKDAGASPRVPTCPRHNARHLQAGELQGGMSKCAEGSAVGRVLAGAGNPGGARPPPQQLWVSTAPRSRTQRPHRGRTRTRAVEGPCGRSQVGQQAGSRAAGRPRREQCGGQGAADLSARGSLSSGAPFPSLDGALTQRCCWGAERGPGNPTPLAPGQCS